jgi:hypothetical protein
MEQFKLRGAELDTVQLQNVSLDSFQINGADTEILSTGLTVNNPIVFVPSLDFQFIDNSMYIPIF